MRRGGSGRIFRWARQTAIEVWRARSQLHEKTTTSNDAVPAQLIDAKIQALNDWRGNTLTRVRELILLAEPGW
jgi:hypothetical protein